MPGARLLQGFDAGVADWGCHFLRLITDFGRFFGGDELSRLGLLPRLIARRRYFYRRRARASRAAFRRLDIRARLRYADAMRCAAASSRARGLGRQIQAVAALPRSPRCASWMRAMGAASSRFRCRQGHAISMAAAAR